MYACNRVYSIAYSGNLTAGVPQLEKQSMLNNIRVVHILPGIFTITQFLHWP
jgi:hypothetical protein